MPQFNALLARARARPGKVVLPEGTDPRVLAAARRALDDGLAWPVLLGNPDIVAAAAEQAGVSLDGIPIIDPTTDDHHERLAYVLYKLRQHKGITEAEANRIVDDALHYGTLMVREGLADGCVAGAVYATATVVRTAMQIVGKQPGFSFVSSFFIMRMSERHPVRNVMLFADCALVINPDANELAEIAVVTGDSGEQLLGMTPEIALLSYSTAGSARHSTVTKVSQATRLAREMRPHWRIIGEVQLDAAVVPAILNSKAPDMADELPVNILVFPNLDAGNIGYKMCERFGGVQAIGPVLQGLARPVNDLSRGCSSEDIYNIIAVTSVQAQNVS